MTTSPQIPKYMRHLPRFAGLPVPFFVAWIDDRPDFRILDPLKIKQCVNQLLCGICGKRLGEFSYLIGGPLSKQNMLFADPAMHLACAEFSIKTCPFLNNTKPHYSDKPVKKAVRTKEVLSVRPPCMYLIKVKSKTLGWAGNTFHITAKLWASKAF